MASPKVHIGTSGWSYAHWKEIFYPKGLAAAHWLNHYARSFSTIEVNTTFYHLPKASTILQWQNQVPHNFLFSIKASRYITHQKRLKDCGRGLEFLYKTIQGLGPKLGPILFQFPPYFNIHQARLIEFMGLLDAKYQHVMEFRHASWFNQEIYDLLHKANIALCITDLNGKLSPEKVTADFVYLRLHGPHKAYQGSYGTVRLKAWQKKMETWALDGSVYCYFDNDEKACAVADALALKKMMHA